MVRNLLYSSAGRAIVSVREDETAAKAMGIDVAKYKTISFVIGAALAGLAGGLYAHLYAFLHPSIFHFIKSFDPLIIVVFGGLGSMTGTVLAAFAWAILLQGAAPAVLPADLLEWRYVIYAVTLVVVMLVRPQGLMGGQEWGFLKRNCRLCAGPRPKRRGRWTVAGNDSGATCEPLPLLDVRGPGQALRRPEGRGRLRPFGEAGRAGGAHRPQRRRQDHRLQHDHRALLPTGGQMLFEGEDLVGLEPLPDHPARHWPHLPEHPPLPQPVGAGQRAHRLPPPRGYGIADALLRSPRFERKERELVERAQDFLAVFNLQDRQNEIAKNLPYGEQRRLEIARALATEPKLLLLDEPAAGMNPNETVTLMELIHFIRDRFKLTILLIEHQMRVVMGICEYITVMDFGQIIARGTPREIQCNQKVIEAYLGTRRRRPVRRCVSVAGQTSAGRSGNRLAREEHAT